MWCGKRHRQGRSRHSRGHYKFGEGRGSAVWRENVPSLDCMTLGADVPRPSEAILWITQLLCLPHRGEKRQRDHQTDDTLHEISSVLTRLYIKLSHQWL